MTLFVVPAIYSIFSREFIGKHARDARIDVSRLQPTKGE